MKKIKFVCLGNICRSPLAEGIAKNIAYKNNIKIDISSAGTSNFHEGESPHENSQKIAIIHGIDISNFKSKHIKKDSTDLYIVMDSSNKTELIKMGIERSKIKKIGDFGMHGEDIPDPYTFRDLNDYERIYKMIETGVINLFLELNLLQK